MKQLNLFKHLHKQSKPREPFKPNFAELKLTEPPPIRKQFNFFAKLTESRKEKISDGIFRSYLEYKIVNFADYEQVDALKNVYDEVTAHSKRVTDGDKAKIKVHLDLLTDFVKYPHTCRGKAGQGYRDH